MANKHYIRILTIVITALSMGCSENLGQRPANEYEQANQYISDGNYNTAIAVMNERLYDNPEDRDARLILASAYAARAGIFMNQYYDMGQRIVEKINQAETFWASHSANVFDRLEKSASSDEQRGLLSTFQNVYKVVFQINQLIGIFNLVPKLLEADRRDLAQAVHILNGDQNFGGGAILYRGVLKLALLKNNLGAKYGALGFEECTINLARVSKQLVELQFETGDMMKDFVIAGLKKGSESALYRSGEQMNRNFNQALAALDSLGISEEVDVTKLNTQLGGRCTK